MIMRNRLCLLAAAALTIAPLAAQAQYDHYVGPEVGVFLPTDSNLRGALGSQWWSIGVSTMKQGTMLTQKVGTNMNLISQSKNGNKVFMGSYTFGIVVPFNQDMRKANSDFQPYFAVRAGLNYTDYAITFNSQRLGGKNLGYNANAEFGIQFGDRFTVSARYDISPDYDGFNFDGLSFSLRYGIVKF